MLNSHVLDVLIGVVFIYFILSLSCSVIMEFIAMLFSLRAKTRKQWVEMVLGDLADDFYGNHLIYSLGNRGNFIVRIFNKKVRKKESVKKKESHGYPSYIPADTFALALISTICRKYCNMRNKSCDVSKFMNCLFEKNKLYNPCDEPRIFKILKDFAMASNGNPERFVKRIEEWFEDAMDRVSGWYKRKTQILLFLIAFGVSIALNLDSIQMAQAIYRDSVLSDALVSSAKNVVAANISNDSFETLTAVLNQTNESVSRLNFYIGWKCWNDSLSFGENLVNSAVFVANSLISNPMKVVGISVTALSVVLGAPFWFDILSKFVRIRTTGEKPKKR